MLRASGGWCGTGLSVTSAEEPCRLSTHHPAGVTGGGAVGPQHSQAAPHGPGTEQQVLAVGRCGVEDVDATGSGGGPMMTRVCESSDIPSWKSRGRKGRASVLMMSLSTETLISGYGRQDLRPALTGL